MKKGNTNREKVRLIERRSEERERKKRENFEGGEGEEGVLH